MIEDIVDVRAVIRVIKLVVVRVIILRGRFFIDVALIVTGEAKVWAHNQEKLIYFKLKRVVPQ